MAVILTVGFFAYGCFIGRWKIVVKETVFEGSSCRGSLLANPNKKFVAISDLHLLTMPEDHLQRLVDSVNAQVPDVICVLGDVVSLDYPELTPSKMEILRTLRAPLGIYAVLGNHDMMVYNHLGDSLRDDHVDSLLYRERAIGWTPLINETVRIDTSLVLAGVAYRTHHPNRRYGSNLHLTLDSLTDNCILLAHSPEIWRDSVLDTFPQVKLQLSGHTHNAQVCFFGWSPARWIYREHSGLYTQGVQQIYVSDGVGCTIPMRVNVPQEVSVFANSIPASDFRDR